MQLPEANLACLVTVTTNSLFLQSGTAKNTPRHMKHSNSLHCDQQQQQQHQTLVTAVAAASAVIFRWLPHWLVRRRHNSDSPASFEYSSSTFCCYHSITEWCCCCYSPTLWAIMWHAASSGSHACIACPGTSSELGGTYQVQLSVHSTGAQRVQVVGWSPNKHHQP